MNQHRVLVVDDEATIAESVAARLRAEGFDVAIAGDGPSAVEAARSGRPDLIVLDVMLPGFDGLEVCRRVQTERAVPILMLTARDSETDLLVGLGVGADDYLTKPFSMRELVARVHAMLRRVEREAAARHDPTPALRLGDLEINLTERRVRVGADDVHLTRTEFDLLVCLASKPRAVQPRDRLLAEVWGWGDAGGTRTVDSHIKALRRKIGGELIRTVHGVGYALEVPLPMTALDPAGRPVTNQLRRAGIRLLEALPRPLDPVRSIKMKLGIALLTSGAAGLAVFWYGIGWLPYVTSLTAIGLALLTSQILAHGMTSPLRQMTAAAGAMARGDYSRRVRVSSRDEVGELGRAFNLMAADLAAADQQRRELIANVSHELRTPISALQAVLENVVDGVAEPDPATLRTALAQTERLGRLVAELLDLSRLDCGVLPLAPETFEVKPFLEDVVRQAQLAGQPATVTVNVQPPQLMAVADPARLHQVVANLLDNAARHGPRGGRISVLARPVAARPTPTTGAGPSGGLVLEVADEGPGIPPDERAAVFERFIRGAGLAESPAALRGGGTGLGLAIARWVVDLHGGTIAVVGDGPGCRIRVTVPPPD